jgi:hypothetical protein
MLSALSVAPRTATVWGEKKTLKGWFLRRSMLSAMLVRGGTGRATCNPVSLSEIMFGLVGRRATALWDLNNPNADSVLEILPALRVNYPELLRKITFPAFC